MRLPPMQTLRAFEAVARLGSLTRAAESLHLTHGAISHQVKALEEELGVALLERAGRGVRLTDAGERFAHRVRNAFDELGSAIQELRARTNPRLLRVSVMPSFAARWLLPRIGRFFAAHPDIDLEIGASQVNVDFRNDNTDLAVRYGYGQWEDVRTEHLMDDAFIAVCSPRIAGGVPGAPTDLSRYTLLRSDNEFWQPWFAAAGLDWPEPDRGPIFNDSSHMLQAAAEGQGVALARRTLLANDLRNGVLVQPFAAECASPRRYYLVYPPRMAHSPKLEAFRAWMREEIARPG